MPGMPFHLEKGHALTALEDLLNDPGNHDPLREFWDGLRNDTVAMSTVLTQVLASAPTLQAYDGQVGNAGLSDFVAGAWFGQSAATKSYWLDYSGDVEGIVREALLLAMETAWGADRSQPLPAEAEGLDRSRPIELLWHCAQRWFDAWVLWERADGPVRVLFATPPHTGAKIIDSVTVAEAKGWATAVDTQTAEPDGDMILVCQQSNEQGLYVPWLEWTGAGQIALPAIGGGTTGTGDVGVYSIHADAGGMNPRTKWS